jgi:von Willebrand factor type A domain/Inner membrane component of T3SS, cytoplasmic domain
MSSVGQRRGLNGGIALADVLRRGIQIMWSKFLLGISLLLIPYAPVLGAEPFRIGPVYHKAPGEVSVVVELPAGVTPTAADFRLLIDDSLAATAQEMKPFRDSGRGMALAVCIDVSGTMARGPLDEAKKALFSFLNGARPEDRIALISFADEADLASSFGETRGHLAEAVRTLKTRGTKTRLYQTIDKALDIFEGSTLPERRRIVVISDGKDEGSLEDAAEVITKANKQGIPIDTVGRARIEEQYAEALRGLSNSTGGYFEHARRDVRTATDALAAIYEKLLRSLVVDFRYDVDDSRPTTQNAWIELQRRDQPPLRVAIPGAIPHAIIPQTSIDGPVDQLAVNPDSTTSTTTAATTTAATSSGSNSSASQSHSGPFSLSAWVWLIFAGLAALLVASLASWVYWAKRRQDTPQGSEITPLSGMDLAYDSQLESIDPVELPRRTQVGGYHFPVPGLGEPTAALLAVGGPMKGQRFAIEKEVVHIGAHPGNDLSIAGDDYLSGNHAYLLYKQGGLFLFDTGSTNGTFVNRHKVTTTGFALSLGDHIQLGTSVFELVKGSS